MDQEKEIITFEEMYKNHKKREQPVYHENKRGYIYALLYYGLIMYVVASVFVIIMLQIPIFRMVAQTEDERVIEAIAQDEGGLAVIPYDTWDQYRDAYKNKVSVIGQYQDYIVLVHPENTDVEELLFSPYETTEIMVFDESKLESVLDSSNNIDDWSEGNPIHLYHGKNMDAPTTYLRETRLFTGPTYTLTDDASSILNFFIYFLMIPGIYFFMKSDLKIDFEHTKSEKKEMLIPILIGYAYVWVGNLVSGLLSTYFSGLFNLEVSESANQQAIISAVTSQTGILMIISAVFIGPVIEELIFRKALFGLIKKDSIAIIVSTLVFGFIHVVTEKSFAEAIVNGVAYFVMGFVFSYIYIKAKRNIMIPIIVHIINNAVSILLIFIIL
ncbi:MAG: type II CAAX endopeptidase family protein [Acholeplasmataceae bacterium]|nr:type II CAAX endopeptidase family protein [Acholeplasmataceae bacterium]